MKLTAAYEPAKDAENHVRAIFDDAYNTYGRNGMKEKLLAMVESEDVKTVLSSGGERMAVLARVTELMANSPARTALEEKALKLEAAWAKLGGQVVFQLEALYGRDWPFEAVHVDLTTLPICPYDFKARRIFVHAAPGAQAQLRILSHELNHFMFYWVYANELSEKLGREKFELLKESVTIFTDPEQAGKPDEEPLRRLYAEKRVHGLGDAVRIGTEFLLGVK